MSAVSVLMRFMGLAAAITLLVLSVMVGPLMLSEGIFGDGVEFDKYAQLFLNQGWVAVGMLFILAFLALTDS
jgi:hypothetical protein